MYFMLFCAGIGGVVVVITGGAFYLHGLLMQILVGIWFTYLTHKERSGHKVSYLLNGAPLAVLASLTTSLRPASIPKEAMLIQLICVVTACWSGWALFQQRKG